MKIEEKIVERLQKEYEQFKEQLEKGSVETAVSEAYRLVCYENIAVSGEEFVKDLPRDAQSDLALYPEDSILLEYLYQIWCTDDNDFGPTIWETLNYRLSYPTSKMGGF